MAAKKPTKKTTSTGSPTLDAANAAKKFKAPKDYKPMTTAQKVALAASLVGPGKVVKGAKIIKGTATAAKTNIKKKVYADAIKKFDAATEKRIADNIAKKSVKVVKRKTAPKGHGLEATKGNRTLESRSPEVSSENAREYIFGKDNKQWDAYFDGKMSRSAPQSAKSQARLRNLEKSAFRKEIRSDAGPSKSLTKAERAALKKINKKK